MMDMSRSFQTLVLYFVISICINSYPTEIPGPKRLNSSIAIIGGDFTGIYMAHLLKEKGFKNIVVYEKEERLGGKQTMPFNHRGNL